MGRCQTICTGKRIGISSHHLEKQSVLCGDNCIQKSRLRRDIMDDEHHWGPDDLNDEKFNEELELIDDMFSDNTPKTVGAKKFGVSTHG